LNETANVLDRWTAAQCRCARRLFRVLGEAGASGMEPSAAIALTELAGEFAWHAGLFFDLLPVRAGIDRDALVAVPVPGADDVLDHVEGTLSRRATAAGCLVLGRVVVPRLHTGVVRAASANSRDLDGPRARALTLVARDLEDARTTLEDLAERLVGAGDVLDEAINACADAERSLRAAKVVVGLVGDGPGA
jgi:hypothetical protein